MYIQLDILALRRGLDMGTSIVKWGQSTGIRLSKQVLREARLVEGDRLEIEVEAPGVIRMRSA